MWMLLGLCAMAAAILHIIFLSKAQLSHWFQFISLSLTALTVCAFYSDGAHRVIGEDWAGLMDTMPSLTNVLWVCTIASILINSISLFKKADK